MGRLLPKIKKVNVWFLVFLMTHVAFMPVIQAKTLEEQTKNFLQISKLHEKPVAVGELLNAFKGDISPENWAVLTEVFASTKNNKLPQIRVQKVFDQQLSQDVTRIHFLDKKMNVPVDIIDDQKNTFARIGKEIITYDDMFLFLPFLSKVEKALNQSAKGPDRRPSAIGNVTPLKLPKATPKKGDLLDARAFSRLSDEAKVDYLKKIRDLMMEMDKLQKLREAAPLSSDSVDLHFIRQLLGVESAWAASPDPRLAGQECIVAGHITRYDNIGGNCGGKGIFQQTISSLSENRDCTGGKIPCVTALFGKRNGKAICVPGDRENINNATANCAVEAPLNTPSERAAFIKSIKNDIQLDNDNKVTGDSTSRQNYDKFIADFNNYKADIARVCSAQHPEGSAKSKVSITNRKDQSDACREIEKRMANLDKATEEVRQEHKQKCDSATGAIGACKPAQQCMLMCQKVADYCDEWPSKYTEQCDVTQKPDGQQPQEPQPTPTPEKPGPCDGDRTADGVCHPIAKDKDVSGGGGWNKKGFFSKVAKFFVNPMTWGVVGVLAAFFFANKYFNKKGYCEKYHCTMQTSSSTSTDTSTRNQPSLPAQGIYDPYVPARN